MDTRRLSKRIVFVFPIVAFAAFTGLKLFDNTRYEQLVSEDSAIEYLQFLFYCSAAVIAALTLRRIPKKSFPMSTLGYLVTIPVLLFIALEEISWGQRLFGFGNPDFFASNNLQGETTFHNIGSVQEYMHVAYILLGLYGAFTWLPVDRLRLRRVRFVDLAVPEWYLSAYFFFVALAYTVLAYIAPRGAAAFDIAWLESNRFFSWRDQEPAELLLSLGFLALMIVNYAKVRGHHAPPAPGPA